MHCGGCEPPNLTPMLLTLMILPEPCRDIMDRAARLSRKGAFKLI